jgi:hypothetical protein
MEGLKDFNPAKDIPNLSGKVIMVTGGTIVKHLSLIASLTSC